MVPAGARLISADLPGQSSGSLARTARSRGRRGRVRRRKDSRAHVAAVARTTLLRSSSVSAVPGSKTVADRPHGAPPLPPRVGARPACPMATATPGRVVRLRPHGNSTPSISSNVDRSSRTTSFQRRGAPGITVAVGAGPKSCAARSRHVARFCFSNHRGQAERPLRGLGNQRRRHDAQAAGRRHEVGRPVEILTNLQCFAVVNRNWEANVSPSSSTSFQSSTGGRSSAYVLVFQGPLTLGDGHDSVVRRSRRRGPSCPESRGAALAGARCG